jgi:hypothetical protein
MFKNIFTAAMVLVFILFHGWQAAADQKIIEDISFEAPSDGEERIIFKLNGTYIPKIFTLQGKQPRVVFDFKDTATAKIINNIINTNGNLIKRIRVGVHEGANPKTRVVLDLRPNKNVDIRQDFDKKKKALVVSVHYAGAAPGKKAAAAEVAASVPDTDKQDNQNGKEIENTETAEVAVTNPPPSPSPDQEEKQAVKPPVAVTAEREQQPEREKKQLRAAQQKPTKAPADSEDKASDGLPVLTSVTFENDSNRGEMVLFKLNEFHPPIVFGIEEGTPRVVCDFKDTTAAKDLPNSIKTAGKFIQKVRIGKEKADKKVRVVLDLTPNFSYDLQQVFFKDDNLFVIIINTLGNAPVSDPAELLKE